MKDPLICFKLRVINIKSWTKKRLYHHPKFHTNLSSPLCEMFSSLIVRGFVILFSLLLTKVKYPRRHECVLFHSSCHPLSLALSGSEHGALRGLRELNVLLDEHLPLQFLQHGLDRVLPVPAGQDGHSAGVHHSCRRDAVHVNPGAKPDGGRLVGVLWAAGQLQTVDPTFIRCSWRSDDHACPVGELNVVLRFQSPRYRAVPAALLTHLKLLQQTEAARHHRSSTAASTTHLRIVKLFPRRDLSFKDRLLVQLLRKK